MGPIQDTLGVEQGGVNSDRLYKLVNNDQHNIANNSLLGANIKSCIISSIGQADDTALVANDLLSLQNLLKLTDEEYCRRNNVTLVPEKTRLLAFSPPGCEAEIECDKLTSSLSINGDRISFSDNGEHVGIIRSVQGNGPNIHARLAAHKRAVYSLLPLGLGKAHNANPAARVRIERLYGLPILLSGLGSLVLSTAETSLISSHLKIHFERLLSLHSGTPQSVIWFLAGCLPGEALLHLRQATLFGMISRLNNGDNILAHHARHVFAVEKPSSKSWFLQLQKVFLKYDLPHPLHFLDNPPSKTAFKSIIKNAVQEHWQGRLREEASHLVSLYFKTAFMSLSQTHPLFTHCGSSPYEVKKAVIQARFLSGRMRVESLSKHWDPSNREGWCLLCHDISPTIGTIEHILLPGGCPILAEERIQMLRMFNSYLTSRSYLFPLLTKYWGHDETETVQFLLDGSVLPDVIRLSQESSFPILKDLFYLTRTYVYKLYISRKRFLEEIVIR